MPAERRSKHRIIICFMALLGAVLAARLFMLTTVQHHKWASYAEDMSVRAVYETGARGDIVDRKGKLIASSDTLYSINISRVDLDKEEALDAAAEVISFLEDRGENVSVTLGQVKASLDEKGYMSYMPVTLAEDVSAKSAAAIQDAGYEGVHVSQDNVRTYPEGAVASHILGYLGRISEDEKEEYVEEKGYRQEAMIGKSGIEKICEEKLRGTDAVSTLQVDSRGNVTRLLGKSEPEKGKTVKLTIDLELQKATEAALEQAVLRSAEGGTFESKYGDRQLVYAEKISAGAVAALDVETGQVLAMASYPDYDPNDFVRGISSEEWEDMQQKNPNDVLGSSAMYNIAAMSAVQPGSTFKPVTALAALECGLDERRYLYDGGYIKKGGRTFGCHLWNDSGTTHGYVDLSQAMKVSCNYYFFDIASGMDLASGKSLGYRERISNETVARFASELGLGESTGIELEESVGNVPSEALKKKTSAISLRNRLMAECETYFKKESLNDMELLEKNIEKVLQLADKDLTLEELIGKLNMENFIKKDKVTELAELCKYTYFDQMEWTSGDTFNIAIGQGDNAYTPLQMARYMAALGNGGKVNEVSLIYDKGDNKESSSADIDTNHLDTVIDAMKAVTAEEDGSLYGMFREFPYEVAAKTGTAQRAGKIPASDEKDYLRRHLHLIAPDVTWSEAEIEAERLMDRFPQIYDSEVNALRRAVMNLSSMDITSDDIDRFKDNYDNFAWTVALAPATEPQIAVAVLLVQGKTSSNAAVVAREIIGKYGEISRWEKSF